MFHFSFTLFPDAGWHFSQLYNSAASLHQFSEQLSCHSTDTRTGELSLFEVEWGDSDIGNLFGDVPPKPWGNPIYLGCTEAAVLGFAQAFTYALSLIFLSNVVSRDAWCSDLTLGKKWNRELSTTPKSRVLPELQKVNNLSVSWKRKMSIPKEQIFWKRKTSNRRYLRINGFNSYYQFGLACGRKPTISRQKYLKQSKFSYFELFTLSLLGFP